MIGFNQARKFKLFSVSILFSEALKVFLRHSSFHREGHEEYEEDLEKCRTNTPTCFELVRDY
jgi:hypothetical protein